MGDTPETKTTHQGPPASGVFGVPASKRSAVRILLAVAVLTLVGGSLIGVPAAVGATNPIVTENQQRGTDNWEIPNDGFQEADDVGNQIKGYPSAPSVNRGGQLTFYVTVASAQNVNIDIYRMGYYQGLGGRLIQHFGPVAGKVQPACPVVDSATSLIQCNWTATLTVTAANTWTDGVYLAVLSSVKTKYQNYVPFVVRNDTRTAALLYQQPVNTYQAYNSWGGKSLYTYNSTDQLRAYKVSFNRPYEGDGSADYFGWEVYLVQWMEQKGYDVTYTTDVDVDATPTRLNAFKGVVIGGHSEYWSKGMYDAAQTARDAGVSLAFMGSNDIYWQVRYEAVGTVARRTLVSYKTSDPPNPVDPITATQPSLTTTQWRETPVNRPEQAFIGVQFTSQTGDSWDDTAAYVVTNSTNPLYAGSGLSNGSSIPGINGYEADKRWAEYPLPSSQSNTLLSNSPYTNLNGVADFQNASIYKALSGAWVFGSGTESWSWALSRPGFVNGGIQQLTTNLLNQMVNNVVVPVTATPVATPIPSAYRSAVIADHPTGYWRLGESSGIVAGDQAGTHTGIYTNSPTLAQTGAILGDPSTSVGFDGTTQYVNVASDSTLDTPTFSVELWAYPTGGAGTYRGAAASRFYPTGWSLYIGAGGAWEFWVNSGPTGMISIAGGTGTLNTWQHVVATFDGTTATLYENGVAVASGAVTAPYQPQTRNPFEIGQSEPSGNFFFPGRLDEPAMYGTALTATQVQTHYSVGTTGH